MTAPGSLVHFTEEQPREFDLYVKVAVLVLKEPVDYYRL
jgi:hypothetical protein